MDYFYFLPHIEDATNMREHTPFGPNNLDFETGISIEVADAVADQAPALAVVDGIVQLFEVDTAQQTATLILTPSLATSKALGQAAGWQLLRFIYRNLDLTTISEQLDSLVSSGASDIGADSGAAIQSFLAGQFPVEVFAGASLFQCSSQSAAANWRRLGFEVVFVPCGIGRGEIGRNHIIEIIKPSNVTTMRLDPPSFFDKLMQSDEFNLSTIHVDHPLSNIWTKRILIELRDEINRPIINTILVQDARGINTSTLLDQEARGISVHTTQFKSTASVGAGGSNAPEDVARLKTHFHLLGYDWLTINGDSNQEFEQTIKLFQSIVNGRTTVSSDGRVDVPGPTYHWLQATNAPRWQRMPPTDLTIGFQNNTQDGHEFGTSWLADTLLAAATAYRQSHFDPNVPFAPLAIFHASLAQGGDTPAHGGHETGINADIRLPRTDGQVGGITINSSNYDRDAARAILQALQDHPLVTTVLFNDSVLINAGLCTFSAGHHNHIHIRLQPPERATTTSLQVQLNNNRKARFAGLPSGSEHEGSFSFSTELATHQLLQIISIEDWFPAFSPFDHAYSEKNKVTPLTDGWPTFAAIAEEFEKPSDSDTRVLLANWYLDDELELVRKKPQTRLSTTFKRWSNSGTDIFALLWDQTIPPGRQNTAEVDNLNRLANGHAILDGEHLTFGSHHQKMTIIQRASNTIAFAGGIDFNSDRFDDTMHRAESPYHDVHARIEGPAVRDLYQTFVERWNAHPDRPEDAGGQPIDIPEIPPVVDNKHSGTHHVRVTRTYPPSQQYPFSPVGDLDTLQTLLKAIRKAERYIYLEDQYATPYPGHLPFDASEDTVGITQALREVLAKPTFEYLIIVFPNSYPPFSFLQARSRKHSFITSLKEQFPDKVHTFYLTSGRKESRFFGPDVPEEIFVHAKVWIIDDVYVKIGSSNCNRRSMTHDSEIDIHVIDGVVHNGARVFARELRVTLWSEHLRVPKLQLFDPTAAFRHWKNPPLNSRILPYQENEDLDLIATDLNWNLTIDPDGR